MFKLYIIRPNLCIRSQIYIYSMSVTHNNINFFNFYLTVSLKIKFEVLVCDWLVIMFQFTLDNMSGQTQHIQIFSLISRVIFHFFINKFLYYLIICLFLFKRIPKVLHVCIASYNHTFKTVSSKSVSVLAIPNVIFDISI